MDQPNNNFEMTRDGVAENYDGTVTFSPEAYTRWKPRLARLGINIDHVITVEDWTTAWELDLRARAATDGVAAKLATLVCFDPEECARLEAHANKLIAAKRAKMRLRLVR
ncbi:MAG: hypothetical protein M0Z85_00350 [Gammaproteobacteria bacterium]|jgi:hypothetical protein|nr:hypothetical protein [Gammaproteobacteria bacterium]